MVISQSFLNHALLQRFNDSDVLLSIRGNQVLNLKLICALCVLAGLLKFVHTFIRLTLPQDFVIVRISCHCSSRRSRTVSSKLHENCVASNVRNTLHVSMQRMSLATTIWYIMVMESSNVTPFRWSFFYSYSPCRYWLWSNW